MANDGSVTDVAAFPWPRRSREAAAMFARGDEWATIRLELGIGARTLERWHAVPEFQAEIDRLKREIVEAVKAEGIANRQNRINAHNDLDRRFWQIVTERAADPLLADVPGGKTGLIVRQLKQVGAGRDAQMVEEYAVDTGLERAIRANMQQAAQELGQWDANDTGGNDGLTRRYVGVNVQVVIGADAHR